MLLTTQHRLYSSTAWKTFLQVTRKTVQDCKELWSDSKFFVFKQYAIVFDGEAYSLKEKRRITRTATDLLKVGSLGLIAAVLPYSAGLLPCGLCMFPSMLPVCFRDKAKLLAGEAEIAHRRPRAADSVIAFIQERCDFFKGQPRELADILQKTPHQLTFESIGRYAEELDQQASFTDMSLSQLVATSHLFGLNPWPRVIKTLDRAPLKPVVRLLRLVFGEQWPLHQLYHNCVTFQLIRHLDKLREDDRVLLREDLDLLDTELLREVCSERGFDTELLTDAQLRGQLRGWLQLSTYPTAQGLVSSNVLVMTQALTYTQHFKAYSLEALGNAEVFKTDKGPEVAGHA
jgi:hypothetical protein